MFCRNDYQNENIKMDIEPQGSTELNENVSDRMK